MITSDPSRAAHNALRDQLEEAALREFRAAAPPPRPRRRWRWRSLAIVLGATFGLAAAAGAGGLISTGEPVPDATFPNGKYRPADSPQLAIKAADPEGEAAWGVAIYTAANGQSCALLGQVRGVSVGVVRDGRFHPFAPGTTGMCGNLKQLPQIVDMSHAGGPRPRTILFGRANPTARSMVVTVDGKRHVAPVGHGGAFLFVFSGNYSVEDFRTLRIQGS